MMAFRRSPNQSSRGESPISAIVLHIVAGTFAGTLEWVSSPESQVSYHYLIGQEGQVVGMVRPDKRAWHSGTVSDDAPAKIILDHPGVNPNRYTIGIGHDAPGVDGDQAWPAPLWGTSKRLVRALCDVYGIPFDRHHIILHREIRTDKSCPGEWFAGHIDEYVSQVRGLHPE